MWNVNLTMTEHKLEVARTIDGFENVLIKHVKMSSAQRAKFPHGGVFAGRCVSRNSSGEAELGVTGHRVPLWLFRDTNKPSTGSFSDPVAVADAPHVTFKSDAVEKTLAYVGIEGLELQTTEFDADETYNINDFLTAPPVGSMTDPEILESAGVITNAGIVYGRNPIVGIVSEVGFTAPHRINMLSFYTLYRPAIAGLPNGIPQPTWQA